MDEADASDHTPPMLLLLACATSELTDSPAPAAEAEDLHGRIDEVQGREVMYLWGTREEMGYAEGALTCDRIAGLFTDYLLEYLVAEQSDYTYQIARAYVLGTTEFDERDLAEMTAYYQGAVDHCTEEQLTVTSDFLEPDADGRRMLELDDLLFANAVADFGCSSFSVWGDASATGDTIHGRNFDWAVDPKGTFVQEHMLKVYDSTEEGARWMSLMVPAMAGCVTCVTDEGVGLTMHNVGGLDPVYQSNIAPRMFAARAALTATEGAEDVVGAAEEVLESRRQLVGNNLHLSFPIARTGGQYGAVVFEYDGASDQPDGEATVRYAGDDPDLTQTNAIVATNHYIKREAPPTEGDSYDRAMKLRGGIAASAVDRTAGHDMLQSVQRDHDGLTAHSILIDSANQTIEVLIAPDATDAAPEFAEPVVITFDELFGGLPE